MHRVLAQAPTDLFSAIDPGPLFLLLAASLAALTCGAALRSTLIDLVAQPVEARDRRRLIAPYVGTLIAACIGIGSAPQLFTIPGQFTYPLAFALGIAVALGIWKQFLSKVLDLPAERFRRK